MKVVSSIKQMKNRNINSQTVRRKRKIYVINKLKPKYKAVQK